MSSDLRDKLVFHFNTAELMNLCFDLKIDYEILPGDAKERKVMELILYCSRHGQDTSLVDRLKVLRPYVIWESEPTSEAQTGFINYSLGNIEVPVMNLIGSPQTPFEYNEVEIKYEAKAHYQQPDYPLLREDQERLLQVYSERFKGKWINNPLPRLSGYDQYPETANDKRGGLILHLSETNFFTFLSTNRSLDSELPRKNKTLRQTYVKFPYELEKSILANTLSANIVVISRNLNQKPNAQVVIRFRGERVALYRNYYQVSASGFMSFAHTDENGLPNPFITAVSEAKEEIADSLELEPSDYKLIGIAVNWKDMDLNVYGFAETGLSIRSLLGDFRRDGYEGNVSAIAFDPKTVLTHISQNKWEPVSTLAMCATLLAYYPRMDVEAVARKIPARRAKDFEEQ